MWKEGMLIAVNDREEYYGTFKVYEIVSYHPDGILLMDKEEMTLALTKTVFDKRKPFPVGIVKYGWFSKQWVYGQRKEVLNEQRLLDACPGFRS